MSFMPTGRALQRFYGWLYGGLAVGALALPLFIETDEAGPWFALFFAVLLGLRSAWHFWRASKLPPDQPAFPDHSKLPLDERAAMVKRAALVGTPAVALLSAWAAWDLRQLESGAVESISLWAPITLAYDFGGFWTAVLGLPALWVAFMLYGFWKLKRDAANAGA